MLYNDQSSYMVRPGIRHLELQGVMDDYFNDVDCVGDRPMDWDGDKETVYEDFDEDFALFAAIGNEYDEVGFTALGQDDMEELTVHTHGMHIDGRGNVSFNVGCYDEGEF